MRSERFPGSFVLAALAVVALAVGCSSADSGQSTGTGIHGNTGGALSPGGSTETGGSGGGGTTASGGGSATGGVTSQGGSAATGGSGGTGGSKASGGAGVGGDTGAPGGRVSGGTGGSGGRSASGGNTGVGGTGGRDSSGSGGTGGTSRTGGATTGGGSTASGGATASGGGATGGATASAGATASGGAGTGGVTGTGGATASGGTKVIATGPVTTTCPGAAPPGITPEWCSCAQWGETTKGDATYYNDIWGSGPGPQCIWVAGSAWGVAANHPSGGNVKAYPNVSYSPNKVISSIKTYTSSFDISVPTSGAWEIAYDFWVKNGSTEIEIMLWVNYTQGKVFPAASGGPAVSNVNVGGHPWNVYYGAFGGHDVVSLLRTTNASSGTVDIVAIMNWIIANKKSFTTSWTLSQFQFGYEIVSDSGVQAFICNNFSVSST
jgi:hypothetical protein